MAKIFNKIVFVILIFFFVFPLSSCAKYEQNLTEENIVAKFGVDDAITFNADHYSINGIDYYIDTAISQSQINEFITLTNDLVGSLDLPYSYSFYVKDNTDSLFYENDGSISILTDIGNQKTTESIVNLIYPLHSDIPYGILYGISSAIAKHIGYKYNHMGSNSALNNIGLWDIDYLQFCDKFNSANKISNIKSIVGTFGIDTYGNLSIKECIAKLNSPKEVLMSEFLSFIKGRNLADDYITPNYISSPFSVHYPIQVKTNFVNYLISNDYDDSDRGIATYDKLKYVLNQLEETFGELRYLIVDDFIRYDENPIVYLMGKEEYSNRFESWSGGRTSINSNEIFLKSLMPLEHEYVHYLTIKKSHKLPYMEYLLEAVAYSYSLQYGTFMRELEKEAYFDTKTNNSFMNDCKSIYNEYLTHNDFDIMDLMEVYALVDYQQGNRSFTRQSISFVHYLRKEYGDDRFWQLYTIEDYMEIYQKSFDELKSEWIKYLMDKYF